MKCLMIAIALSFTVSAAHAADSYIVDGKQSTVLEAVKTLMQNKNAEVLRCVPQELSAKKTGLGLKKKDS